ncbi:hypothetical protein [Parapedobacter defluvii]|uniref:hypothetical protein n=1 Tax=Parapedobacter defluvii TaxID=2045106 RepID=UPI0033404C39
MATKQQILEKITVLLQDINHQFEQLADHATASDDLKGDLFEATVNYFAAHVTIYNKLLKNDTSQQLESKEETVFTPTIDSERENEIHAEQIEEVSPAESEIEAESEVSDESAGEADTEEEVTPIEINAEENETESSEEVLPVDAEDNESADDLNTDGSDEEAAGEADDAESEEDSGDRSETEAAEVANEVKEVVNEVTIENKEVQVEPERPTRPLSLNERISAQRRGETTTGVHPLLSAQRGETERIADIKSAISLNDKLLFIKDLFNGYSLAYSEAIELLNRYDDFASADAFLQANYAQKNNWADKPVAVDKLYAVLRKRFG